MMKDVGEQRRVRLLERIGQQISRTVVHQVAVSRFARQCAAVLDRLGQVDHGRPHRRMPAADCRAKETVPSREIDQARRAGGDRRQAGQRCGIEPSDFEHRPLVVAPGLLVPQRLMEIDTATCAHQRFQLLEEAPLGLVPSRVTSESRRRSRNHGASRERGQPVASLAFLQVFDVSQRAEQQFERDLIEAQSICEFGCRARLIAQRFEHAELHAGHDDSYLQRPE
jgi:hypothetical protein